jgi:hypothetical protein
MCEKIVFLATILARKLWKDAIKHHGQIDNFLGGHENLTGEKNGHLYMLVKKYPHFIIGGEGEGGLVESAQVLDFVGGLGEGIVCFLICSQCVPIMFTIYSQKHLNFI